MSAGEKRSDSASVIGSLKQRIFKLEQSLKDKESSLTALQKDHKATSVHELKVQMETMYQEILRLRKVNQVSMHVGKLCWLNFTVAVC